MLSPAPHLWTVLLGDLPRTLLPELPGDFARALLPRKLPLVAWLPDILLDLLPPSERLALPFVEVGGLAPLPATEGLEGLSLEVLPNDFPLLSCASLGDLYLLGLASSPFAAAGAAKFAARLFKGEAGVAKFAAGDAKFAASAAGLFGGDICGDSAALARGSAQGGGDRSASLGVEGAAGIVPGGTDTLRNFAGE